MMEWFDELVLKNDLNLQLCYADAIVSALWLQFVPVERQMQSAKLFEFASLPLKLHQQNDAGQQ